VIDSQIKGFVTDADAKTGLAGHVVSRMGASAARALIAGIFTGAGDMMKTESTTVSTSGLGSVSTVDPSKIGSYALGNGLSAGSQRLAEFYLTLAKQATPVVEANADKHVTVVISEGKELVIKDLKRDDDDLINEEI
jgi:conjugal transfer pilus assembly protein TraB